MIYHKKNQAGFSLVETLVAISILLIVVAGPMTLSMRAAKSSSFASEQVQAYFLAQEGIELAQKTRDDLLLASFLPVGGGHISDPWGRFTNTTASGMYSSCFQSTGCGLYWRDTTMDVATTSCAVASNCLIHRKTTGESRFTHVGGAGNTQTLFTRTIKFVDDSPGVRVISEVTWRTGSLLASQRVQVETYLYNIYGTP